MHKNDTQSDISTSQLEERYEAITAQIKSDHEFGSSLRWLLLKDSVERLFAEKHGMPIETYIEVLSAHCDRVTS